MEKVEKLPVYSRRKRKNEIQKAKILRPGPMPSPGSSGSRANSFSRKVRFELHSKTVYQSTSLTRIKHYDNPPVFVLSFDVVIPEGNPLTKNYL